MALRLDFTDPDYFRDPAARLAKLGASGPVVEVKFPIIGKVWVTTTYEAAGRVLKDNRTFTLRKEAAALPGFAGGCRASCGRSPTTCSPWTSRTTRGCAASSMKPFAAARSSTWSRASSPSPASSQASLFAEGSPADLVDRYARRLPIAVIFELLGLPPRDRDRFMAWGNSVGRHQAARSRSGGRCGSMARSGPISKSACRPRASKAARG